MSARFRQGMRHGAAMMAGAAIALAAAGCNRGSDDPALAKVNGTAVTRSQLDSAVGRVAGGAADSGVRRRVLESLVLTRAMAQLAEKAMSKEQREALERKVDEYREQLLAKAYLAEHAASRPLMERDIRAYYERNAAQFGGGVEKRFDMIASGAVEDQAARDLLKAALQQQATAADWGRAAAELAGRGHPVQFRRGGSTESALPEAIRAALDASAPGAPAQLVEIEQRAYLLRVTGESQLKAKPLEEVRDDIVRGLVAAQLKEALDGVSHEVLRTTRVEYVATP